MNDTKCYRCRGRGLALYSDEIAGDYMDACDRCDGTGKAPCRMCGSPGGDCVECRAEAGG
jgi:hypothetical protein